jgi:hypothetical protein
MKEVLVGTINYHEIMQEVLKRTMQYRAGYIPQKMDEPECLPPVAENIAACADTIVQAITDNRTLSHCNPRFPYLFMAWVLVGSDNPDETYMNLKVAESNHHTAAILIRLALGDAVPETEIAAVFPNIHYMLRDITKVLCKWADRATSTCTHSFDGNSIQAIYTALRIVREAVYSAETLQIFRQRLTEWAYLSDDETLQIARQLLFDILETLTEAKKLPED